MKSITPIISVILLVMMTLVAAGSSFFFINSNVASLESQGSLDTFPGMDNSRISLVSVTGSKAILRNDGTSPVTDLVVLINGELLNYTLNEPILPGEIKEINYAARQAGEDLKVEVIYNQGKVETDTSPARVNTPVSGFSDTPAPLNTKNPENFEDYPVGFAFNGTGNWTNIGIQNELVNATVELINGSKVAAFYDFNETVNETAEIFYTFPLPSNGSGNSTVMVDIDFGNPGMGSRALILTFYDQAENILQGLILGNGFCGIVEAPATIRSFFTEPGGAGIQVRWSNEVTYEGNHSWELIFNEDDETIRYFIDDIEIYANNSLEGSYENYLQSAGAIVKVGFSTGIPYLYGGNGTEVNVIAYVDDLTVDWI